MFIAHIPAGYLMAVSLLGPLRHARISASLVILAGTTGGFFPDLDLLYFYLVDERQTHHHRYFAHWPVVWLALLSLSVLGWRLGRGSATSLAWVIFSTAGLLHLVLDTLVGDIWWFAPFIDQPYAAFTVPAVHQPWWLNFVLHWSFAVELLICAWALLVYRRRRRPSVPLPTPESD